MAKPVVYNWPAINTTAICSTQSLASAGSLIINGSLASPLPVGSASVVFTGISRTVSLTSINNLSGVQFTINGFYRGSTQTETRAGPNNNTVYTTNLFDRVTSITTNNAVTAVSAGSGNSGQTHWFTDNYYATVVGLSVQVVISGTIGYTFLSTLDDVQTNANPTTVSGIVMPNPDSANAFTTLMNNSGSSNLATYIYPTRYACLSISGTGSLRAIFLQQGID